MDNTVNVLNGRLRSVHPVAACAGRHCWVHDPSSHALIIAPVYWDPIESRAYRVCDHQVLHPDPDDCWYRVTYCGEDSLAAFTHRCDGCCIGAVDDD